MKLGDVGITYGGLAGKDKDDFGIGKPFVSYMDVYGGGAIRALPTALVQVADGERQNLLHFGMLTDFVVRLPDDPAEADTIANVLVNIDLEIELLVQKLTLLKDQKKYLLNSFVTGAIRTPETL